MGGNAGGWAAAPLSSDSFTPVVENLGPVHEKTWERGGAQVPSQSPSSLLSAHLMLVKLPPPRRVKQEEDELPCYN